MKLFPNGYFETAGAGAGALLEGAAVSTLVVPGCKTVNVAESATIATIAAAPIIVLLSSTAQPRLKG